MHPQLFKIARFITSGGLVTCVNIGVLYVLEAWFGVWYLYASIVSFLCCVVVNFLLQKYWVFVMKGTEKQVFEMTQFLLIALLNLVLNTVLMYSLVSILGIYYVFAQVFCILVLSVLNYFLYGFVFQAKQ